MTFKIYAALSYLVFAIIMMINSRYVPGVYLVNIGSLFLFILMILDIKKNILSKSGYLSFIHLDPVGYILMFLIMNGVSLCLILI